MSNPMKLAIEFHFEATPTPEELKQILERVTVDLVDAITPPRGGAVRAGDYPRAVTRELGLDGPGPTDGGHGSWTLTFGELF